MAFRDDVINLTNSSSFRHFWMLEDTSGTAEDLSAQNNVLTYTGTAGAGIDRGRPGIVSDALFATELNRSDTAGSRDGYLVNTNLGMTNLGAWSIMMWYEHCYDTGAEQTLFHYATATNLVEIKFGITSAGDYFAEYQGGARFTFNDPAIQGSAFGIDRRMVTLNRSVTSTRLILGINGVSQQTITGTGGSNLNEPGSLSIGQAQNSLGVVTPPNNPLQATVNAVAFWSTTPNDTQFTSLRQSGQGEYLPYELIESTTAPAAVPTVGNFSHSAEAILKSQIVTFDVTNATTSNTLITASYTTGGVTINDVVLEGGVAAGDYTVGTSTVGKVTTYSVSRVNGWRECDTFSIAVTATNGPNSATGSTAGLSLLVSYPPNMQPTF